MRVVSYLDMTYSYCHAIIIGLFFSSQCPVTGNSLEEVLHQYSYGIFGYSCGEPALCDVFVQPLFNFTPMV